MKGGKESEREGRKEKREGKKREGKKREKRKLIVKEKGKRITCMWKYFFFLIVWVFFF